MEIQEAEYIMKKHLDEWNDVTGFVQKETGYYWELLSVMEDAAKDYSEQRLETRPHETIVMLLLRETAMRCRIAFPKNEQDETWFNEGTDKDKCGDFMQRLFNTMEVYYDD